jgi:PBP1b-binding outer membrane lipoprotein LpoB
MHKRYLAVACCAVLAVAGCGSSNSKNSNRATTTGSVFESVFTTDLNSLCQSAKTASGGSLDKAAAALSQSLPQFKAITPPVAHQAAYSKFLAHLEALAAAAKDRNTAEAHAQAGKLGALAKQLHLSGCTL